MSSKNLLSRNKLLPVLMVLISAFFLQAFQSPVLANTLTDDTAQEVIHDGARDDVVQNELVLDDSAREDVSGDVVIINDIQPAPQIHASIKADPTAGTAPLTVEFGVHFDGRVNFDDVSVLWSFGNGDTDSALSTKYTFREPGEYVVTLVIDDGQAEYVADTVVITVYHSNRYCTANCLIASKLQLEAGDVGDTSIIAGSVLVTNERGRPMEGAVVRLVWTRPDGRQIVVHEMTGRDGVAQVKIQANISGIYYLRVDNIEMKGFTFDPTRSVLQTGIRR